MSDREVLRLAWADFLEALRSDWTTTCKTCVSHGHYDYKSCKACGGVGKRIAA